MRPFSAFTYIRGNRGRLIALVSVFILTFVLYLGGLYISNAEAMYQFTYNRMDNLSYMVMKDGQEDEKEFAKAMKMLQRDERISCIMQGEIWNLNTKTIMGFDTGNLQLAFHNEADFMSYCEFEGIEVVEKTDSAYTDETLAMSRLQANNLGLKIGDTVVASESDDGPLYTLAAITDEEGYSVYYFNDFNNQNCIFYSDQMTTKEYQTLLKDLKENYDVAVVDRAYYQGMTEDAFSSFHTIYFFVIVLLSLVMAITINAAFVGHYQHRHGEFALYRAIGISRRRIRRKVISEVVLFDAIGIVIGTILTLLLVYLLNSLVLWNKGYQLFYYDSMSLLGMLANNLFILIPVCFFQSRRLEKSSICDY